MNLSKLIAVLALPMLVACGGGSGTETGHEGDDGGAVEQGDAAPVEHADAGDAAPVVVEPDAGMVPADDGGTAPDALIATPDAEADAAPKDCTEAKEATDCPGQTCIKGKCAGVCAPNTQECEPLGQIRLCDPDGQWGAFQGCGTNNVCTNGACHPCQGSECGGI